MGIGRYDNFDIGFVRYQMDLTHRNDNGVGVLNSRWLQKLRQQG